MNRKRERLSGWVSLWMLVVLALVACDPAASALEPAGSVETVASEPAQLLEMPAEAPVELEAVVAPKPKPDLPVEVGGGVEPQPEIGNVIVLELDPEVVAPETSGAGVLLAGPLRAEALEAARRGRLDDAETLVDRALELAPMDPQSREAKRLLAEYGALMAASQAEQAEELATFIVRIERYLLAQEFRDANAGDATLDTLTEKVKAMLKVYDDGAATIAGLELATPEEAQGMRRETLAAMAECTDQAEAIREFLAARGEPYFTTVAAIDGELLDGFDALTAAWNECDFSTSVCVYRSADTLRPLSQALNKSLADMETMVADAPWKSTLALASAARELVPADQDVEALSWYRRVVDDTGRRGHELMDEAEWTDAMIAFGGLEGLDRVNPQYRQMAKIVRRHVRAEQFYGHPEVKEGETEAPEPYDWEKFSANVDAKMVRTIIARIDSFYVTPLDYRQLIDHGVTSLKVLAETPQAGDSFPGLGDKDKCDAFIEELDRIAEHFAQKEGSLDHLDLVLAFNRVRSASASTVELPDSVVAVEFTDGFLGALDEHTATIWPSEVLQFEKSTKGHFTGVGIQVDKEPGEPLHVASPMAGTPAYNAGIRMDDYIIAVDGVETADMQLEDVIDGIVGPKGSTVVLTIKRKGVEDTFDVDVVRDTIVIDTIKGWELGGAGDWDYLIDAENKIGYIRLTRFTEETLDDMRKAILELDAQGVESLVLDLRFNPGGLLRQAHGVVDEFVPEGQIVMTQGRQVRASSLDANGKGMFKDGNLVVMVDEYSASAAEIVSGALKDLGRATIVGHRSYGKGSVQQVLPLGQGDRESYLKVTSAYYYVGPSEILVHRHNGEAKWGVDPDLVVGMSNGQMQRWLDVRRRTDLIRENVPETLAEDLDTQLDADIQLQTALLLLRLERTLAPEAKVTTETIIAETPPAPRLAPGE